MLYLALMTVAPTAIADAARILREGGLVAFPTETVYGLGADATDDRAVARIFAAKGRPSFNPLIVHVPDLAAAEAVVEFNALARRLAARFWPGPLTLVLPRKAGVSLLVSAGLDTVAVRVPADDTAQALLRAAGRPIAAPSANASGTISATTAAHVADSLGGKVDMILDGGPAARGIESTVIGFARGPTMLRLGAVARGDIEAITGKLHDPQGIEGSPGRLESHYAPNKPLRLNATDARPGEALLGFGTNVTATSNLSPSGDLIEAAANLFAMLRELDAGDAVSIAVAPIPQDGLGEAINDRLTRAARR
ncbi:MAG TPA: L-threonylcarbamoyladenylate synthase [Rhizomicrobium sp.]